GFSSLNAGAIVRVADPSDTRATGRPCVQSVRCAWPLSTSGGKMDLHRDALAHAWRVGLGSIGLVVLAGCGGGGGSDTVVRPDPPPAAPPADPVVYDPNPAFSKHLTVANSQAAHAAGFTGEGVRIGVIDSGVNRNHP